MQRMNLFCAAMILAALQSATLADEISTFHKLYDNIRVAEAQEANIPPVHELSDSFPTEYVDPSLFTEPDLVEQDSVPAADAEPQPTNSAETEAPSVKEYMEAEIQDPAVAQTGVACGCGEAPIPAMEWSESAAASAASGNCGCTSSCGCTVRCSSNRQPIVDSTGVHLTRIFRNAPNRRRCGNCCP